MRSILVAQRSAGRIGHASTIRPWVGFLSVQLTLVAGIVVCGLLSYGFVANLLSCMVNLVAVAAVVKGVTMYRPRSSMAWLLLGGSQLGFAAGVIAFFISNDILHDHSFPAFADAIYLLFLYPAMIAAVMIFVRIRTPGWHTATLIDAAVLATSAGLLAWIFLLGPMSAAPDMNGLARTVGLAYPVMDLLLLALALRLTLGAGTRTTAYYLLVSCFALDLTTDTAYLLQLLAGTYTTSSPIVFGYLASSLVLGVAVLHPSMPRMDEISATEPPAATPGRLVILTIAALIAPTVLMVQHIRNGREDTLVIAGACVCLFLLVLARMAGLVAAQRRMASIDSLTGLYTRRFFEPSLELLASRSRRHGGQLGILFVDLDHFKRVNDTHGHDAGDEVLTEFARRLRHWCRSGDIVARYGGEEFAILLPDITLPVLAVRAEALRRSVADAPMTIGGHVQIQVTASIGTAVFPDSAVTPNSPVTPDDAVRLADAAMYAAKQSGRDRVVASGAPR